jgi:hypothetical protein
MRERDIRKALKRKVEAWGGSVRAVQWINRAHAPDVLALFPEDQFHVFIETKAPGGKPTPGQLREHERMRDAGCVVKVISTIEQLDDWLEEP